MHRILGVVMAACRFAHVVTAPKLMDMKNHVDPAEAQLDGHPTLSPAGVSVKLTVPLSKEFMAVPFKFAIPVSAWAATAMKAIDTIQFLLV